MIKCFLSTASRTRNREYAEGQNTFRFLVLGNADIYLSVTKRYDNENNKRNFLERSLHFGPVVPLPTRDCLSLCVVCQFGFSLILRFLSTLQVSRKSCGS